MIKILVPTKTIYSNEYGKTSFIEKILYSYENNNDIFSINIQLHYKDNIFDTKDFTIKVDKNINKGSIYSLLLSRTSTNVEYSIVTLSKKYDISSDKYPGIFDPRVISIAIMYIDENKNITFMQCFNNNDEYINTEDIKFTKDILFKQNIDRTFFNNVPEAYDLFKTWIIRKNEVNNIIDSNNSLAYLEVQVDLLYKLVNELLKDSNIDISKYNDLLDSINQSNILDHKDINKCKDELLYKSKLREIQDRYYNMKEDQEFINYKNSIDPFNLYRDTKTMKEAYEELKQKEENIDE